MVFTQYAYKEYASRAAYLDNARRKKLINNITQFLDAREIVFIDITDNWFVTHKSKILGLDSTRTLYLFRIKMNLQQEVNLLSNTMKYINY